jgi:WD40 repeat protein
VLVQSTKVEAIKWTGCGDGIIAGGIEVVLWRNNNRSWEIAWKLKAERPQTLVSAAWSIEGPLATAAYPSELQIEGSMADAASKCVLVCCSSGKSDYVKSELRHPLPVSMIQWRLSPGRQLIKDAKHSPRDVLLTCCLDGTVRLWCEVDSGKVRKMGKDINNHETTRRSFCVVAVIEVSQALNGTLGMDLFVLWATEIGSLLRTGDGVNQVFSTEGSEHEKTGRCEWLVGFGPGMLVHFWAIHCLDDIAPMRFPRVTLWKRQELQGLEVGSNFKGRLLLNKFVMSRNHLSGPPIMCSLIHLLPSDSLIWSLLYTKTSNNIDDSSLNKSRPDNYLSCSAAGILNLGGHAGKILQVAVHPYSCEVELTVSLDSNGLLLFWSLSTISNCIVGRPSLIPTWKRFGKFATQDSCSKYTCLRWAPSVLEEELVLFMGHVVGIDCFIVKICQNEEENIECHYLFTIPFTGCGPYEDGPTNIFSIPLSSTCNKTFKYNKFMLLGIWMKGFQALSWEVTLHSYDLSVSCCECNFDTTDAAAGSTWKFEGVFGSKRYCLGVIPCSSYLPDPHSHDQVTSFAVVCPGTLTLKQQKLASSNDLCGSYPAYIMATGCFDGSLKLWRSITGKPSTPHVPWELVGMFIAHQGPISAICLTDYGQKIATVCAERHSNTVSTLHIWHSVHLKGAGTFMLEDTLFVDKDVVALNWLALGNGQLLLGVCMQNELQVYAPRPCGGQTLLNFEKSFKMDIWVCIAFAHTFCPIHDFLWGPRAAAVVIHDNYFSVSSQWLFHVCKKHKATFHLNYTTDICLYCDGGTNEDILPAVFRESSIEHGSGECKSNKKSDYLSSSLFVAGAQSKCDSGSKLGLWSLPEVVERFSGCVPSYHPEVLLMNIYSGTMS